MPYKFCLYFFAFTEDIPPNNDLNAVENREWLWKKEYTQIELKATQLDNQYKLSTTTDQGTSCFYALCTCSPLLHLTDWEVGVGHTSESGFRSFSIYSKELSITLIFDNQEVQNFNFLFNLTSTIYVC